MVLLMTLEYIRKWFNRLPESERDLPIVILNGIAYTPRMILHEVERGSKIGEELQTKVEAGSFGTTEEEAYNLALIRLKEILKRYPPNKPVIAVLSNPPVTLTPEQIIEQVEKRTPLGKRFVEAELQQVKYLLSMR